MTTMIPQAKNEGEEELEMGVYGADKNRTLRVLTGVLLILTPIAFNVFFTLLSVTFEYPDILPNPRATSCGTSMRAAAPSSRSGTGSCSPPCCSCR